jgi:gluconokinase
LHGEDDHKLVDFVFINGSFELFQERIVARKGHFMPSTLLQSQFDTLQVPTAGETAGTSVKEGKLVVVDASNSIEQIVEQAVEELSK